jgi:DNA primase
MNRQHIEKFLPLLKSNVCEHQTREGWVIASCPFAKTRHSHGVDKHPSFGVKIEPHGLSNFHCFSCGSSGDLMDIIITLKQEQKYQLDGYKIAKALEMLAVEDEEDMLDIMAFDDEIKEQKKQIYVFSDKFVNSFQSVIHFPEGVAYLKERGLTDKIINDIDVRYDSSLDRVVFPIKDWNGDVVGMHGRHIYGQYHNPYYVYKEKGRCNPVVWYGEDKINPNEPVILVESVFDRLRIYKHYPNVICSLSAGIGKNKVERISVLNPIITIADSGKGGIAWLKALKKYLPKHNITEISIDDYGVKDPGELTDKQIKKILEDEFL